MTRIFDRISAISLTAILCLFAACQSPSQAWPVVPGIYGSSETPSTCPQAVDLNGSCAASIARGGSFQQANWFSGYTGASYPSRPNWNVPGVDFPVGVPAVAKAGPDPVVGGAICGLATLADPATATKNGSNDPGCGIMPQNCTYATASISAQLSGGVVTCSGTASDIVFRGFNMGIVGGHGGTYLTFSSSHTGKKTIAFNYFEADNYIYSTASYGNFGAGSQGDAVVYANTFNGKWRDSFTASGIGTAASVTAGVMTISACSQCQFFAGQYIGGWSNTFNINIHAQLTGTGGAPCPDPTCNGGIGTYQLGSGITKTSASVVSQFQMGGGMNLNTSGNLYWTYNAILQQNGRVVTAQMRSSGGNNTLVTDLIQNYNYIDAALYNAPGIHFEIQEWVVGNETLPIEWRNVTGIGNVHFQLSGTSAGSNTAPWFISTGFFGTVDPAFTNTYTNVTLNNNVVAHRQTGAGGSALMVMPGSAYITNLSLQDNWIDKTGASNYNSCGGGPEIGTTAQSTFFTGSQTSNVLNVTLWQGGDITLNPGMHVYESKGYIISQITNTNGLGTPGKEGTYSMTPSSNFSSGNRRAVFDAIVNAPTISANYDLITGSLLTQSQFLSLTTASGNPCLYPGF